MWNIVLPRSIMKTCLQNHFSQSWLITLFLAQSVQWSRDFQCLYCNDKCQPFLSLEAVRKHIIAKGHCKLRYGDLYYGDRADDEEGELEDFYDYSSRSCPHFCVITTKEHNVRLKVLKGMNRCGFEAMRSKIGMKSNIIRNLPKNVPH